MPANIGYPIDDLSSRFGEPLVKMMITKGDLYEVSPGRVAVLE